MKKVKIFLTSSVAEGKTKMDAYCNALSKAGITNLNLITLSSVLPHNSEVVAKKPSISYEDYGKRMYVIMAELRTSEKGKTISAGIGWLKEKKGTGHGMVVEIVGDNETRLKKEIKESLEGYRITGKVEYEKKHNIKIESIKCINKPVCALVVLAFDKLEGWRDEIK
jgi:arginine decarboxylase